MAKAGDRTGDDAGDTDQAQQCQRQDTEGGDSKELHEQVVRGLLLDRFQVVLIDIFYTACNNDRQ